MKLKAHKMGTMKALKESLKKGGSGGNNTYIKNVPADGITVRFLTEPEEWFGYMEYWDGDAKTFVPMVEGEILPDGAKPSFRYLTNAIDLATDRVVPLKLAKTVANMLILKYDKYDTILDRPYELQKHGEGLDTTYDITPDAPSRFNIAKYDLIDLEKILIEARVQATGETATAQSSEPTGFDKSNVSEKKTPTGKPVLTWDYGQFTYEQLFPEEQIRIDYTKDELESLSPDDSIILCDFWEIPCNDDTFVKEILQNQKDNLATISAEDEVEDEDEDEDVFEFEEEELNAMSIADLRKIAGDIGIAHKGISKDDLIEAIINEAEA